MIPTPKQMESAIKNLIETDVQAIIKQVSAALLDRWTPGKKLSVSVNQVGDKQREMVHAAVVSELGFKGWKAAWKQEQDQREQHSYWYLEVEADA